MIHSLAEAEPRPSPVIVDDGRHVATREIHAFTAAIVSLRAHDGCCSARLNAYVDGLGHRTIHLELSPHEHACAVSTLQRPGTLVRGSGILRAEGSRLCLLRPHGFQILAPGPEDFG